MTANEIKNAWNTFKKEIAKEITLDLTGCCYMNAKQIANCTATITLQSSRSYDDEITYYLREIDRVSGWGEEQKERIERITGKYREKIADLEARKAAHGTRENEVRADAEQITNSKAFKKLAETIGIKRTDLELNRYSSNLNIYQIRISY